MRLATNTEILLDMIHKELVKISEILSPKVEEVVVEEVVEVVEEQATPVKKAKPKKK